MAAAKLLALVLVGLAGAGLALALDDPPSVPPETAAALERAEQSAQDRGRELREAGAINREAAARAERLQRRLRATLARERRLRRALRRARQLAREAAQPVPPP